MEKTNQLLRLQEERFQQIQKAQINYKKAPKERLVLTYLDTRLENLEKDWQTFKTSHDHLVANVAKDQRTALAYFSDDMYDQCEEMYIMYKSDLKIKIQLLASKEKLHTPLKQNPVAEIKLPKIKIPTFSGKYIDWPSFLDLFTSIVHNNTSLDDVQKLHYLKSSLTGEAEILLRSISVTSQNYGLAWETLNNRYNNKRYLSNCVLKRLFGAKGIVIESALNIKQLLDLTVECLSSLNNLGLPTGSWDVIVIYMTVSKLDPESQKLWEQHISADGNNDFPTFNKLKLFMETRFRSLEMTEYTSKSNKVKTFHASSSTSSLECAYCQEDHYIYQCKQFAKQPYTIKHEFIQNNNMCFNCLNPNHTVARCMRGTACRICNRKHHSLLHPDKTEAVKEESHQDQQDNISSHFIYQPGQVLLATALVNVVSRQKKPQIYRALIDQGSQASFVTEDLVQTMGLKRERINGKVTGLSEGHTLHTKYMVEVFVKSRCKPNFTILVKAYVLKKITNYLPTQPLNTHTWPELTKGELADPEFNQFNKINILLGAEVFTEIIDVGLLKSPSGIIAQQTQLGWILSGSTSRQAKSETEKQLISMHLYVNEIIKKFWEIENENLTFERKWTKEEQRCESIYKETTRRTDCGRYEVNLPFKEHATEPVKIVGKTKEIATYRFLQLEKRFKRDSTLHKEYSNVIQEYLDLGHMTLAEGNEENVIYLPHHAVIRNDKDTTKIRTVFDASASGSRGSSLNDILLIGPALQKDLRCLIMQWRQHKIAIISDIVKMYRQVQVSDKHTNYQRIVWRKNPNEELKSYKLLTVTFGTASAPYLAVRTLIQVAEDEGQKYPRAAEIVKTSFYMDDLLTGASDETQAAEIYTQVTQLLKGAGFELQKWSSNSDRFLKNIAQHKLESQPYEIKFDQIIKTLGLYWDRVNDKFKFHINLAEVILPITKRSVLAEVARLFDPFGWLAPVIITAKIFIQRLWLCTIDWDDELPSNLQEEWLSFREQLPNLHNIELDRWFGTQPNNDKAEIHGFADASTTAYAAVLYMRTVKNNQVYLSILESKTKVAPLKQISVPRLELCAAVLLAKLLAEAALVLKIPKNQIYAYTDSTVALAWIQASPVRWQTFVANRVAEIQTLIDNDRWSHVSSKENPADLASRGLTPSELQDQKLWWEGPHWLKDLKVKGGKKEILSTDLEEKPQSKITLTCIKEEDILERFSTLNKMLRVLTFCRRFLRLKSKGENREEQSKHLTCKEMKDTLAVCLKYTQEQKFKEEIQDLKESGRIKKRSKLISLSPYLDDFGLLRVGGRLQAAKLPHEYKHPVLIPGDSHLAILLVRDAHTKLLHGGMALMMNFLRSRYWIIGLKSLVKECFRKCVVCIKHKALTIQPQMGGLPKERVNPGRPFKTSGVDFAGPIQIRTSKGRGQKSFKGYICLFICMVTRAIHLEVVSDLTTQGFLAAFRRFVSRRGQCSDLWSDNGLNFVGAAKELTLMLNQGMSGVLTEVAQLLANDGTTWHFIPPRAPNFGGLWEAGIKSVKTHLAKTIGAATLTFEEMSTLLTQIEACLNSRPIGQLNDHPDDLAPLTPAHFLIGEPLITIPDTWDDTEWISPLKRWELTQRMMINFWKRWSKEFLHTMQQRNKWQLKTTPPQIGELVVVKDDNLPPAKWLLARITQLYLGPDGEARVADLRCKGSTLKRPLSKLIALPRFDTA